MFHLVEIVLDFVPAHIDEDIEELVGTHDGFVGIHPSEAKIKEALQIPKTYRLVALLPIGVPTYVPAEEPNRKALSEIVQNPSSAVHNVF